MVYPNDLEIPAGGVLTYKDIREDEELEDEGFWTNIRGLALCTEEEAAMMPVIIAKLNQFKPLTDDEADLYQDIVGRSGDMLKIMRNATDDTRFNLLLNLECLDLSGLVLGGNMETYKARMEQLVSILVELENLRVLKLNDSRLNRLSLAQLIADVQRSKGGRLDFIVNINGKEFASEGQGSAALTIDEAVGGINADLLLATHSMDIVALELSLAELERYVAANTSAHTFSELRFTLNSHTANSLASLKKAFRNLETMPPEITKLESRFNDLRFFSRAWGLLKRIENLLRSTKTETVDNFKKNQDRVLDAIERYEQEAANLSAETKAEFAELPCVIKMRDAAGQL